MLEMTFPEFEDAVKKAGLADDPLPHSVPGSDWANGAGRFRNTVAGAAEGFSTPSDSLSKRGHPFGEEEHPPS